MNEKGDIKNRDDIKKLVDAFYANVQLDELLYPVFMHLDFAHHLPIMYNFWSSVLLGDLSYSGNPLQKHLALAITTAHFERWLLLFKETVMDNFEGEVATEAIKRSHTIAQLFQHKMGLVKG